MIRNHELSPKPSIVASASVIAAIALSGCMGETSNIDNNQEPKAKSALQESARSVGEFLVKDASHKKIGGKLTREADQSVKGGMVIEFTRTAPTGTHFIIAAAMKENIKGEPKPSTTYSVEVDVEQLPKKDPNESNVFRLEIDKNLWGEGDNWGAQLLEGSNTTDKLNFHMSVAGTDPMTEEISERITGYAPLQAYAAVAG